MNKKHIIPILIMMAIALFMVVLCIQDIWPILLRLAVQTLAIQK
jgi:hypothetical protein